jgi:hypothetical protein
MEKTEWDKAETTKRMNTGSREGQTRRGVYIVLPATVTTYLYRPPAVVEDAPGSRSSPSYHSDSAVLLALSLRHVRIVFTRTD